MTSNGAEILNLCVEIGFAPKKNEDDRNINAKKMSFSKMSSVRIRKIIMDTMQCHVVLKVGEKNNNRNKSQVTNTMDLNVAIRRIPYINLTNAINL